MIFDEIPYPDNGTLLDSKQPCKPLVGKGFQESGYRLTTRVSSVSPVAMGSTKLDVGLSFEACRREDVPLFSGMSVLALTPY